MKNLKKKNQLKEEEYKLIMENRKNATKIKIN